MTTEASETAPESSAPAGPIVARAGGWYRLARYIMFLVLVTYGGMSIYDGFYSWQPQNWSRTHPNDKLKSDWDIGFNKLMGAVLPPLGMAVLIRAIFNSRGRIRLEDEVVYVPGHPPVPLEKVDAIDRELWDRKGIAYIDYDLNEPGMGSNEDNKGTFKLDDFVYQREPIDQIFAAIESSVLKTHPGAIGNAEAEEEPEEEEVPVAPPVVVAKPAPIAQPPAAKPVATVVRPAVAPKPAVAPRPAAAPGVASAPRPATAPRPAVAPGTAARPATAAPRPATPGAPRPVQSPAQTQAAPRANPVAAPRTGAPPKMPPPRPPQSGKSA